MRVEEKEFKMLKEKRNLNLVLFRDSGLNNAVKDGMFHTLKRRAIGNTGIDGLRSITRRDKLRRQMDEVQISGERGFTCSFLKRVF